MSQSVFSFDSPLARMGVVEVTGTEGTMVIPDPNTSGGEVKITRAPDPGRDRPGSGVAHRAADRGAGRSLPGVLDLARHVRSGGQPLASRALGYHVLDTLVSIEEAVTSRQAVNVDSTVDPVPLVDVDRDPFVPTL